MSQVCLRCGYSYKDNMQECPLCSSQWSWWDLIFPALPTDEKDNDANQFWGEWLGMLPLPAFLEVAYDDGLLVRLAVPPGTVDKSTAEAWSSLTRRRMRLAESASSHLPLPHGWALFSPERVPSFTIQLADALPALTPHLQQGKRLRIWLLKREDKLHGYLRQMVSYQYGVDSGVSERAPNVWGIRLGIARTFLVGGGLIAALGGGFLALHQTSLGIPMVTGGGLGFIGGMAGMLDFMRWRSIPSDIVEQAIQGPLFSVAFSIHAPRNDPPDLKIWGGETRWLRFESSSPWPDIRRLGRPVGGVNIGAFVRPPAQSEVASGYAQSAYQDVPAPPPSRALTRAPLLLGRSVSTGAPVGIDPDAHALIVGGSRSGKSSAVYGLLRRLVTQGDDAPGLFLVDPHLSLADAFLDAVDRLPPHERAKAVERLVVVDASRPEVVPMNLLTLPDYSWAGGALVELGNRIWEDYWGPRMQAALLGLFRLGHAWNANRDDVKMGLIHTVFMAYNKDFREVAMQYMRPDERVGTLALNALLGQMGDGRGRTSWLTEVISPVISKLMAMEMSPWLYDALHRDRFVDMKRWIENGYWIVLRLSTGEMGRPAARIAAATLYNVFEAVYRKTVTAENPKPFYVIVDEAQEIAAGMKLENPLAEGGKFGMRVFLLTQSLTMLRQIEGFESAVQALLANTSTQMFFSPDPDDIDIIRRTLNTYERYGDMTFDLPSLQCWLRARLNGRWQPPALARVEPLPSSDPVRVQRVIDDAIEAHPDDYAPFEERGQNIVDALIRLLPPTQQAALGFVLEEDDKSSPESKEIHSPDTSARLGL